MYRLTVFIFCLFCFPVLFVFLLYLVFLVLLIFCFYFCLFYFPSNLSPVIILPPTSTVPQASPVLDLALYRRTYTHKHTRTQTHLHHDKLKMLEFRGIYFIHHI